MIPINRNGNCGTAIAGTGSRVCDITTFGDVVGFNLHPKTFKMTVATDSITSTTWKNRIKAFDVRNFLDIYDFTQDTPENEVATSSRGIMSTIRDGKPQFSFTFTKGGCFHKALYAHKGDGKWDVSLMFETGILMASNEEGTELSGFDLGRFDVSTLRLMQGTDPQSSTAVMQLTDPTQFNTKWVFLTWAELGVNLSKIDGIVDTTITYVDEPTTSTTFSVQVASSCNLDDVILGLDEIASWRLGGTQATPRTITAVAYDADAQAYEFTLSGALADGDTVQPTLIGTGGYDVATDDAGGLYKGQAALFTVGA